MIKTVLAGTATRRFTDVLEAVFSGEENKSVREAMEAEEGINPKEEEKEEEVMESTPQPGTSTLSKALKRKAPPLSDNPKKLASGTKSSSKCSLADALVIYPSTTDQEKPLHAGVDSRFISARKSSSLLQRAGYGCLYSSAMREEGTIVEECDLISSTKGQLSTHIRRLHLGAAVVCYVCDERWWSASSWLEHMEKSHPSLKKEDYFVKEGTDINELKAALQIKKEVAPEDL